MEEEDRKCHFSHLVFSVWHAYLHTYSNIARIGRCRSHSQVSCINSEAPCAKLSIMATTVAKGQPVELTSHTPILMDVEMDPSAQSSEPDEDLYTRLKTLQRQLEFYEIQVGHIRLVIFTRALFSLSLNRRYSQVQMPAARRCKSIDLHAA